MLGDWKKLFSLLLFTAVDCPAPLVYKDCYSRLCEPGCNDLLQEDPCPGTEGECFPGCYCPEGLVREGNQCVKPTDCRDCEYLWLGFPSRDLGSSKNNVNLNPVNSKTSLRQTISVSLGKTSAHKSEIRIYCENLKPNISSLEIELFKQTPLQLKVTQL